eukprot:11199431-Lingulodinium_polyedra.AAC.1
MGNVGYVSDPLTQSGQQQNPRIDCTLEPTIVSILAASTIDSNGPRWTSPWTPQRAPQRTP